jgi:phosphatidylglycerol:prolipoprotein diacylglycerol transferase
MWQTLFYIPHDLLGIPVFGVGWALGLLIVGSAIHLMLQARYGGVDREVWSYLPVMVVIGAAIVFVLPGCEEVVDGQRAGIAIRGYGVMMLVAIIAGVALAAYRARRMGLDPEMIYALAFYMFVLGILGARLFFIIEYRDVVFRGTWGETFWAMFDVTQGGLVVYGSLIGAMVAMVWFVRKRNLPLLALSDLIAPSLLLGLAIGRIGCLMNGCCYGGLCNHDWAISFPPQTPPFVEHLATGQFFGFRIEESSSGKPTIAEVRTNTAAAAANLKKGDVIARIDGRSVDASIDAEGGAVPPFAAAKDYLSRSGGSTALTLSDGRVVHLRLGKPPTKSLPVHPTQIYSSVNAFLLFALLMAYYPFRRRDGEVIALLLTLYPITRFLLEWIRCDEPPQFGTTLTISQNVSVVMLVLAIGLWIYVSWQPKGTVWPAKESVDNGT